MGDDRVKMGFQKEGLTLPLDRILPVKHINGAIRGGRKYATIVASIKEIGLVEPPIVYPAKGGGAASQLLTQLAGVDALINVVRAFEDPSIPHPAGSIDVARDIGCGRGHGDDLLSSHVREPGQRGRSGRAPELPGQPRHRGRDPSRRGDQHRALR